MEPLGEVELRVLGSLVEKERTVPDTYPMTLNGLRTACNQASSRDPVVAYDDAELVRALESLKDRRLVRFVHAAHGARTTKYRQVLDEALELDGAALAVLALLVLRGPQTAGELRTRSERLHAFESLREVEETLDALASRDEPLVVRLDRRPGQRDDRWAHLLGGEVRDSGVAAAPPPASRAPASPDLAARVDGLEARIADLERRLEGL